MGLSEILDAVVAWAQSIIGTAGYPGLILVMFLENIFPPIPSEVILPLAGSLVIEGRFTLVGITLVGAVGSVAGALVFYGLGRLLGEVRIRALLRRYGRWQRSYRRCAVRIPLGGFVAVSQTLRPLRTVPPLYVALCVLPTNKHVKLLLAAPNKVNAVVNPCPVNQSCRRLNINRRIKRVRQPTQSTSYPLSIFFHHQLPAKTTSYVR